ncbi:response regulator transcription factor [Cupriavidus sp. L7L]|uniref:LuxR C-terminal-related transcriptional regulator n=1 Tax=Cupriavidus sp. L7L TaxID=2546443 RepID=UPI0014053377|nr:response regulator transcription factor [Cupriavidus sp. L7L]
MSCAQSRRSSQDLPHSLKSTNSDSIHILIVEEVRICLESLATALGTVCGLSMLGGACDAVKARADIAKRHPAVVLVDMGFPDALELIRELRRDAVDSHVIAFAVRDSPIDIIACAEAGAAGYATVDASIDQLVESIFQVVSGKLECPPNVAFDSFRRIGTPDSDRRYSAGPMLTERELQVLHLLSNRLSNKEIARALNIAVSTVKNHVHHVLEKMDAPSRAFAARNANRLLITPNTHSPGHHDLDPAGS